MSDTSKIIIGLADAEVGQRLGDVLQHARGATNAVTVGATVSRFGVTGGTISFFGGTGSTRATSAAVTDFASLKVALQNYGLVGL